MKYAVFAIMFLSLMFLSACKTTQEPLTNQAPRFSSDPTTVVVVNTLYSYEIFAKDEENDSIKFEASELPEWLTLEDKGKGNATLTGTPDATNIGSVKIVLNASDGELSSNQDFAVKIIAQGASWTPERNKDGVVTIDSSSRYGELIFENEQSNEEILTGFPVGHNLPKVANRLFYNLKLDGYGGLPAQNCLTRGYLMSETDATFELCNANENKDLFRVWGGRNPNLKHVLVKNVEIKNAFRTYNVVDGTVVTKSSALPHTDTFQSYFGGSAQEDPEWLVIQDSIIKNSDNNLMIVGGTNFKGFLYQNLTTTCEQWFIDDKHKRQENDYTEFTPDKTPPNHGCGNYMNVSSDSPAEVWLVDVFPGNNTVNANNKNNTVVLIGANKDDIRVTTRDENKKRIEHPNVKRYETIEAALADGQTRPPFLDLSCAGWQTKPLGCESVPGYKN